MSDELLVPLAEHFHSIQGEGMWVGTPMHFIRLAGCLVGQAATKTAKEEGWFAFPILSNMHPQSYCRTYDGRYFGCDTDFGLAEKVSVESLISETHEKHICLTGGEPLAHLGKRYFEALLEQAKLAKIWVHVETSGTIWDEEFFCGQGPEWITVAPKFGVIDSCIFEANEVKLLVDENFDVAAAPKKAMEHPQLFFCPINGENEVNQKNVALCMNLLQQFPNARLSCQWHKFLGVR